MADAARAPKETRERVCPHCLSISVVALGRIFADRTGVRSAYRCEECAKEFWVLRSG
jgi:transposase-like protein